MHQYPGQRDKRSDGHQVFLKDEKKNPTEILPMEQLTHSESNAKGSKAYIHRDAKFSQLSHLS